MNSPLQPESTVSQSTNCCSLNGSKLSVGNLLDVWVLTEDHPRPRPTKRLVRRRRDHVEFVPRSEFLKSTSSSKAPNSQHEFQPTTHKVWETQNTLVSRCKPKPFQLTRDLTVASKNKQRNVHVNDSQTGVPPGGWGPCPSSQCGGTQTRAQLLETNKRDVFDHGSRKDLHHFHDFFHNNSRNVTTLDHGKRQICTLSMISLTTNAITENNRKDFTTDTRSQTHGMNEWVGGGGGVVGGGWGVLWCGLLWGCKIWLLPRTPPLPFPKLSHSGGCHLLQNELLPVPLR